MAEVLDVRTVHEGWSSFRLVDFRLDDGSVVERSIEDHGDATAVLPYDPVRRVALLVRQFRAPIAYAAVEGFPEAPAGIIDPGEDAETCGRREVMEETGVRLSRLDPLGCYWASPGSSMERSHLFLAEYAAVDRVEAGGGVDEHEDIEVLEMPLRELADRLGRGELGDLKMLSLVQALMLRRPELFA